MGARKKKGRKQKNRAYYMRFKPKMRRRREAKTDYQARRTLTYQDKDRYNTPKYRFVVRFSNRLVTCQIVTAKIIGDEVLCVAYSSELPRYGLEVGLKNYSAAYATGLLCARRCLKKLKLDQMYKGVDEVDGEHFLQGGENGEDLPDNQKRPFACVLDVGLRRTTTGAKVYAAMKGAVDGGIYIPHSNDGRNVGKQFPGFYFEDGQANYSAETCRKYIFGGHVADYMNKLQEEDTDKFEKQFAHYISKGVEADDLEEMYENVHAKIRADPNPRPKQAVDRTQVSAFKHKRKKTMVERRDHVLNKILALRKQANAV